jgi:hypothetical protein
MKLFIAILLVLICIPSTAYAKETVLATTAITLPVDSVTIYPDGLIYVKRMGSLDISQGQHDFVVDVPSAASKDSVLLSVTNATIERIVYDGNPVYTLNISSPGYHNFTLSYLMNYAGSWEPKYDLHLANGSLRISADALVRNNGGEDLKNVLLKLVAGLPANAQQYYTRKASQINYYDSSAPANETFLPAPAHAESTGELETFYIFELPDREDLEMDKNIAFPLFERTAPIVRIYTWDAYDYENGPVVEEIRANNTLQSPWPAGEAMLYRDGEYVSTIDMPFTPSGTNASIVVGSSPDLKASKKLMDYNVTEGIREIKLSDNQTHAALETTENWTVRLKIENNLDRKAILEASDIRPKESKMISISIPPTESTATSLKWVLSLDPNEKVAIDYTYQVITIKSLE